VVASPAATWLRAERDRAGRVIVEDDLSLPGHSEVFVTGDTAAVKAGIQGFVPGLAPAAKQMGRYVGQVVAARVANSPGPGSFKYRHQGDLATIGRRAAIVSLGKLQLTGFLGWLFWSVVHIYFLIGARNRVIIAFDWLWQYLTFERGARLITDVEPDPSQRTRTAGGLSRQLDNQYGQVKPIDRASG
jgi:NADH:ubiquinone reductase (H+-translocating)